MFERNRVDNAPLQSTIPAELQLLSGEILKGRFYITASRAIYDVLNGESQFLEFETYNGERAWIAKTSIAAVRLIAVPSANKLNSRLASSEHFDPYQTLGVQASTEWDDVRAAYLELSKLYHPDLFAGVALPPEVSDYLSAMSRRVNAAYRALEVPHIAAKNAVIEKAKPIYTSPARIS